MFCESKSTVLKDLKEKGILGEYNDVLNTIEFEKFNKEFTRFIELKYNLNSEGELAFSTYETQTRFPYGSRYYRDDIKTTIYAQTNEPLFEALDEERIKADIKNEVKDRDVLNEPEAEYPEDDLMNPMFMREPSYLQHKFNSETKKAMLSFMEGLNIKVVEGLDEIIPSSRRTWIDKNGNMQTREDPLAAFDLLQKFLALKENISDKDVSMQTANVIFSFLGKKSKLGIELWKGINSWSKYQEVYDKYNNKKLRGQEEQVVEQPMQYGENSLAEDKIKEVYEYDPARFNAWAHKQTIIEFLSSMLIIGIDNNYIGKKRTNPDIAKDYFESLGYRDKYAKDWITRMFNNFMNWIKEHILNNKAITIYKEAELRDTVLDIVDDVYKKNYIKFIRSYYENPTTGKFFNAKGQEFEQKFYDESLKRDPFAKEIVDKLFNAPYEYFLSGSLVLRKYGRVIRALSEDLHDIDGVISLQQFESEKNAPQFLKWIEERGVPLSKERTTKNSKQFVKELMPYLEGQSWYQDLKKQFPTWTFKAAFIGKDHKKGESVTISGYVEHPTETVLVENADGSAAKDFFNAEDNGKTLPKRYVLDFFLRTQEGNYPEVFDHYYKDWKQIFEAKINMGRGKDLADLIYFQPFREDKYKYTNKGFRYFTFADDVITDMPDITEFKVDEQAVKNQRSKEAANALGQKIAQGLGVQYMYITDAQAKQILESRKKTYNGEPAFFFGGTVYIVGDNVNFDTVLHELSHPLLRAIGKENKDLFNNLYEALKGTTEGDIIIQHVKDNYPELSEESPLFKEEALAYALQRKAANKVTNQIESLGFEGFIGKLLDALRNMLKKIFGAKTRVSEIDVNTSIDKLADMLLEDSFEYETDFVTNDDLVAYAREIKEMAEKLTKDVKAEKIQEGINEMYATTQLIYEKAINFRTRSPQYQRMLKETLFVKGETNELLPKIKRILFGYQTVSGQEKFTIDDAIKNAVEAERMRNEDLINRARSFVNTVGIVNNIAKNIYQDLDAMDRSNSFNSRDAIALLFLYRSSIRSYNDMFNSFDEMIANEEGFDITQTNDIIDLINEAKNNLMRSDKKIRDIYKANSVDFYVEITGYMNDFLKEELGKNLRNALTDKLSEKEIDDLYNIAITQKLDDQTAEELYTNLEKKGVESKYIKKFIDDYNAFLVNQDKITDGLSGKLRDVSWFNRFFESYTSSNDPIVGGLAIFINDQKTEASQRALDKSYKFRKELEPLLQKVGYTTLKTRQLTDMLMFKDKLLYVDPKTKKPIEKEVFTFLNEFGNGWRYKQDLLEYQVDEALASEDDDKIRAATNALKQFKKDYMWDDYIPEFYEKDAVFEKHGELGKMAWLSRKMALDKFNNESNEISDELERFQKYSTLQELWREYQMLSSLKYADGTSKVDDPATGVYDLSIAKILLEHKESTKDYYEFAPRPGSLQTSFNQFLSLAESNGEDLVNAKDEWIKQNIRIAYTQEFYDSRKELTAKLKQIQDKVNSVIGSEFDISNAYNEIYNLMFAYKDQQGQPIPSELGVDKMKMIKELNQKIINYKAAFDTKTGLSNEDAEELELYIAINKKNPERLTPEQKLRYRELLMQQTKTGLSLAEVATMQSVYAELSSLTQKVATEYYVDSINEHLQRLNVATLTVDQVDNFINSDEMKNLLASDGKFVDWFVTNHVSRKVKNRKTRRMELKYERSMANSISIPKNEKYYEKTTLFNELTGKDETFRGLPNARHSTYKVKDKYRTGYDPATGEVKLEVGVHIDNKGQPLPRAFKVGDKNSALNDDFINKDYMRLKEQPNSPRFQLLELMKKAHLSFQEDKSNKSKLYLDMPRYVLRDNLSRLQAGKFGERYSQIKQGITQSLKDSFGVAVDENELEHNYTRDNNLEEYRMVNTDLNSEEISYIPVSGMYNLETDNTDPDVIRGMFKYLLSLETQSKLHETLPLVNSILETLADPVNAPKTPNTYSKTIKKIKGKLQHTVKPGASNNRLGQVRSLIEREYHGKQFSGEGSSIYLDKFMGQLQKLSARASLAVNISSDLKNRYGQIVQNMLESAGGEFITPKDLAQARLWAATTMIEWTSKSVYTKGVPALSSQIIEMFDSAFKFKDDFGRSVSRNMGKDMMNGEWMYNIRKNLEMEAALQLFGAFLNGQKVEQKLSNGKTITVNYKDAWQVNKDTGIAELKPGIDPAWSNRTITHDFQKGQTLEDIAAMYGVTVDEIKERNKIVNVLEFEDNQEIIIAKSEKFKQFRNRFQGVSHKLYGSYDDFAQAEGNLYLPYRMFTFMRKWFVPMLTNRWGARVEIEDGKFWSPKLNKRYDWMTGKTNLGFYLNAFLGMKELIKSKGKYWSYMPEDQKRDLMKTLAESLFIITAALLASMLFGYDPDDEERFKKLEARSGALGTDDFKTWGFIQNHMLILLLGTQMESSAFIPLPTMFGVNLGADDYIKIATTTTSSFGNTVGLYAKMMEDVFKLMTFNDKAYYSRQEGEYWWQQKGVPKIYGRLLKSVGITGSTGDVTQSLEGLENAGKIK
jgi:predicted nucleotidyltransferase